LEDRSYVLINNNVTGNSGHYDLCDNCWKYVYEPLMGLLGQKGNVSIEHRQEEMDFED
jgi:hypothetical protein